MSNGLISIVVSERVAESSAIGAPVSRRAGSRRRPAEGRLRLLTAAEQLFATRGLEVPNHEIVVAAGLHNQSAVTYHFQSRAGLLDAVRERHEAPIAQHRHHLISSLPGPEDRTTRQLVDAHIQPLAAEMLRCAPSHWARLSEVLLLHQPLRFARDIRPSVHARLYPADTVLSELLELTVAHLRHLPRLEAVDRVALTMRFLNSALARWERDSQVDINSVAPLATFTLTVADLAVTMLNAPSCVPPPIDAQLLPSHPAASAVPMLTTNVVVSAAGAPSSPRLRVSRPGHSHSQDFDEEEVCQTVRSQLSPTASRVRAI